MTNEELKNLKLNNWKSVVVAANVEEDIEDIHIAIGYHDHGDHFLFIQTKDGKRYEYGFWCGRNWEPDYEELLPIDDKRSRFIRNPEIFRKHVTDDYVSSLSNELYFCIDRQMKEDDHWSVKKYGTKLAAQYSFDIVMTKFDEVYDEDIFYNKDDYKTEIMDFLRLNEIDTPENIERLNNTHLSSKVDGIDGYAGKRVYNTDCVLCDDICFAMVDGKEIPAEKLAYITTEEDEFGECSKLIPLNQFDENAVEKYRKDISDKIGWLVERFNTIEEGLDGYSLQELCEYMTKLGDMCGMVSWCQDEE